MKIRLIITDDAGKRNGVPFLRDEISVGRGEGCTIRLPERNISRKHALLTRDGDEIYIEDLDSYNGVILNGNRIARRTHFFPGDIVQIGDFTVELEQREDEALEKVEINQKSLLVARHIIEERGGDTQTDIVLMTDDEPEISEPEPEPEPDAKLQTPPPEAAASQAAERPVAPQPPGKAEATVETRKKPQTESPAPAAVASQHHEAPVQQKTPHRSVPKAIAGAAPKPAATEPAPAKVAPAPETPAFDKRVTTQKMFIQDFSQPQAEKENEDSEIQTASRKSGGGRGLMWAGIVALCLAAAAIVLILLMPEAEQPGRSLPIEPIKKIEVQQKQVKLEELLPREDGDEAAATADSSAALEEARRLMREMLWREAELALNEVIDKSPGNTEVASLRDKCRKEDENRRNYTEGMRQYGQKKHASAYLILGQIDRDSVYYEKSSRQRDILRGILLDDYVKTGWADYKKKNYDGAMSYALKALELDAAWTDALELKELCENAKKSLEPQKDKDPYNAKQHYQMGVIYFKAQSYEKAIEQFLSATRQDPDYALAYRAMGSSYASMGDMDKAMLSYRKYVKLAPGSPDVDEVKEIIEEYQKKANSR